MKNTARLRIWQPTTASLWPKKKRPETLREIFTGFDKADCRAAEERAASQRHLDEESGVSA